MYSVFIKCSYMNRVHKVFIKCSLCVHSVFIKCSYMEVPHLNNGGGVIIGSHHHLQMSKVSINYS